jgi:hypothetical protein
MPLPALGVRRSVLPVWEICSDSAIEYNLTILACPNEITIKEKHGLCGEVDN